MAEMNGKTYKNVEESAKGRSAAHNEDLPIICRSFVDLCLHQITSFGCHDWVSAGHSIIFHLPPTKDLPTEN